MSDWLPIERLDKSKPHYVIVHEDGAMRMQYWEPSRRCWTKADVPFEQVTGICSNPDFYMELPPPPSPTGAPK